jgi:hypothetical protein
MFELHNLNISTVGIDAGLAHKKHGPQRGYADGLTAPVRCTLSILRGEIAKTVVGAQALTSLEQVGIGDCRNSAGPAR